MGGALLPVLGCDCLAAATTASAHRARPARAAGRSYLHRAAARVEEVHLSKGATKYLKIHLSEKPGWKQKQTEGECRGISILCCLVAGKRA